MGRRREATPRRSIPTSLLLWSLAIALAISGALLSLGTPINDQGSGAPPSDEALWGHVAALPPHDPIIIDWNTGFTNASGVVWGAGTESDPYIIEGWEINASAANGIEIRNTDAYFVVRDCYIHGDEWSRGISLDNCVNGILDNNTCLGNFRGIQLIVSSDIIMSDNNCSSNGDIGIAIYSSNDNTLVNNTCSSNLQYGIILGSSDNNTLVNNTIANCFEGLVLQSCVNNSIYDNTISNCSGRGIALETSDFNSLRNNTCYDNGRSIRLDISSNNTVYGNYCTLNTVYCIELADSSNNNAVCNNTCLSSGGGSWSGGMQLWGDCNNNSLLNNTCMYNNDDGIRLVFSCNNNTLADNHCGENTRYGISLLSSSSDNEVSGNVLSDNMFHGVCISSGSDNHVWNNTFHDNNGAGDTYNPAHIQAYDDSPANWWNSTDGYGNWWSDWTSPDSDSDGIVDVPYPLDGGAGAVDHYPLTTAPTVIPEFSAFFVAVAFLAAVLFSAGVRRRKVRSS